MINKNENATTTHNTFIVDDDALLKVTSIELPGKEVKVKITRTNRNTTLYKFSDFRYAVEVVCCKSTGEYEVHIKDHVHRLGHMLIPREDKTVTPEDFVQTIFLISNINAINFERKKFDSTMSEFTEVTSKLHNYIYKESDIVVYLQEAMAEVANIHTYANFLKDYLDMMDRHLNMFGIAKVA